MYSAMFICVYTVSSLTASKFVKCGPKGAHNDGNDLYYSTFIFLIVNIFQDVDISVSK